MAALKGVRRHRWLSIEGYRSTKSHMVEVIAVAEPISIIPHSPPHIILIPKLPFTEATLISTRKEAKLLQSPSRLKRRVQVFVGTAGRGGS